MKKRAKSSGDGASKPSAKKAKKSPVALFGTAPAREEGVWAAAARAQRSRDAAGTTPDAAAGPPDAPGLGRRARLTLPRARTTLP